ncbi:MAG: hypothetical protein EAZ21_06095 [Betaproteobacteria bacterium]|nr:MAG: hypothetical protein EAZ21_06095 [Betaproteobacteria bacterium]
MRKLRSLFCGAFVFASLVATVQGAVTFAIVDSAGDVGSYSSMQLNASGLPRISYRDATNGDLRLAVCMNVTCTASTRPTVDSVGNVGLYTSLQLNASGFAVISYFDDTNGHLKLAVCSDVFCNSPALTTVDSTGTVGGYTSLRLNGLGNPVISYYDYSNGYLKLATCNNPTCTAPAIITVDNASFVGTYTSLQLSAGSPVISYYDITNFALKLAVCNDFVCAAPSIRTVDGGGIVGWDTSLQLSSLGYPAISYHKASSGDLRLAVCDSLGCTSPTITTVDSTGDVGSSTSLRINAAGRPVITYRDNTNGDLKLAVCESGNCTTRTLTTLDSVGSVGQYTSMQLNAAGFPVISYYDATNGDLKLATLSAASVTSVTVPPNGNYVTGQNVDFTVNWTDQITVTGTPTLSLTVGSTTVNATYLSGSGTNALVFRYTVLSGQNDNDGISVGTLNLNGGTMSWAGFPAVRTLNSVGNTSGIYVNRTFTVTASAGANGALSCVSPVASGNATSCLAIPNAGFATQSISGCSGTPTAVGVNSYVTGAITANCTVSASFAAIVNGACGTANGVATGVAPSTNLCSAGAASAVTTSTSQFTWSCNSVNGGTNASCAAPRTYTITPSAGANGALNCLSPVVGGNTTSCTATPNAGFQTQSISGCSGTPTTLGVNNYTTGTITTDCTVTANFVAHACRLDINDDAAQTTAVDGLLILRYMLGFRGVDLLAGLPSPLLGNRNTVNAIENFLSAQDYNVKGLTTQATATRDGLVILRHLQTLDAGAMIAGTDINATDAALVRARIQGWCP